MSWKWSINSPTWVAPSHQLLRSTKKSTTGWQREAVHLADYIKMCGTTDTWKRAQKSACFVLLSLPPHFYMAQSCGSLIITIYYSTSATFTPSSASTEMTLSPILKALNRQRSPTSTSYYWSPSLLGWTHLQDGKSLSSKNHGGELFTGYHDKGAPKEVIQRLLQKINWCLSIQTKNYDAWYLTTNHAVSSFKNTCRATLKEKRHGRRNHNTNPSSSDESFSCSHCNLVYLSCISLTSHEHASSWCESLPSWSSFHE